MSVDGVNDLQKPRPKPTTPRPMKTRAFLSPTSRGRPLGPKCCWNQVDSPTPLPVRTHLVDDAVHNERVFQYVLPNPRVERQSWKKTRQEPQCPTEKRAADRPGEEGAGGGGIPARSGATGDTSSRGKGRRRRRGARSRPRTRSPASPDPQIPHLTAPAQIPGSRSPTSRLRPRSPASPDPRPRSPTSPDPPAPGPGPHQIPRLTAPAQIPGRAPDPVLPDVGPRPQPPAVPTSGAFQLPALLEPLAAATARPRLDLRHRGGRRPTGLGHDSGPKAAPPGPHVGSAPGAARTSPRCIPEGRGPASSRRGLRPQEGARRRSPKPAGNGSPEARKPSARRTTGPRRQRGRSRRSGLAGLPRRRAGASVRFAALRALGEVGAAGPRITPLGDGCFSEPGPGTREIQRRCPSVSQRILGDPGRRARRSLLRPRGRCVARGGGAQGVASIFFC